VPGEGPVRQKGAAGEDEATGANPTDRGKPGTKRHLLTEGKGIPIACLVTGANRTDMKKLAALLDATVVEPAPTAPPHLVLDRGYDYQSCRDEAVARGFTPHIPAKTSTATPLPPPGHPDRHPPRRWVVEVGHSWFNRFRRLLTRWEKQGTHYLGFVQLAAVLIIYRKVRHARALPG
jgi:putative transposase